jgi:hypothetical protein
MRIQTRLDAEITWINDSWSEVVWKQSKFEALLAVNNFFLMKI